MLKSFDHIAKTTIPQKISGIETLKEIVDALSVKPIPNVAAISNVEDRIVRFLIFSLNVFAEIMICDIAISIRVVKLAIAAPKA